MARFVSRALAATDSGLLSKSSWAVSLSSRQPWSWNVVEAILFGSPGTSRLGASLLGRLTTPPALLELGTKRERDATCAPVGRPERGGAARVRGGHGLDRPGPRIWRSSPC